jgi:hypothetical protein
MRTKMWMKLPRVLSKASLTMTFLIVGNPSQNEADTAGPFHRQATEVRATPSMKRNRQGWFLSTAMGLMVKSTSLNHAGSFPLAPTLCGGQQFERSVVQQRPGTANNRKEPSAPWAGRRVRSVPACWARKEFLYDEEDDRLYDSRPFREVSNKGTALRRDDDVEWSYDDDDDDDDDLGYNKPSLYPRRRRYDADDEDYDPNDDSIEPESAGLYDDDEEEEEPSSGNFWFNPKPGLDGPVVRASQQARVRDQADLPPSTAAPQRRRRQTSAATAAESSSSSSRRGRSSQGGKRTTFRSGTPPPPAPIRDLYNRLFWYGFDPSDEASTSPADPTMFGGTKGKFNGLAYLGDGGATMDRPMRRPRNKRIAEMAVDDDYDDNDDDDDEYFEDTYEYDSDNSDAWEVTRKDGNQRDDGRATSRERPPPPQPRAPVTPPFDPPMFMRSPPTEVPYPPANSKARRRKRPPSARGGGNGRDWVSREVSSWFGPGDGDDDTNSYGGDGDEEKDRGGERGREASRGRRSDRRRSSEPSWSLFGAVESFLGLDRMDMDARALEYDRKMGIERGRNREGRQRRRQPGQDPMSSTFGPSRRRERRKGYAYRYEDDDGTPPIAEVDASPVEDDEAGTVEADATKEPAPASSDTEMSWEERALAVERVPPSGIPAWGPTGDLGIDARTKAILDALEDIQLAKEVVSERTAAVEKAKEDVAILRIDAELEKKRLRSTVREARTLQESIRQLDFEVQESSRALRYAQSRLKMAQNELAALERRHWAVLSFYNPVQVEEAVQDAIREFEQNEPAARLHRDKPDNENFPLGSSTVLSRDADEEQVKG